MSRCVLGLGQGVIFGEQGLPDSPEQQLIGSIFGSIMQQIARIVLFNII